MDFGVLFFASKEKFSNFIFKKLRFSNFNTKFDGKMINFLFGLAFLKSFSIFTECFSMIELVNLMF